MQMLTQKNVQMLLDIIPYPVAVLRGTEFVFTNRMVEDVFGYTMADTPSVNILFIKAFPDSGYRAEVSDKWLHIRDHVQDDGKIKPLEFDVTCADGTVKPVECRVVEAEEFLFVVLNDLTETKRNQEILFQTEKMMSIGRLAEGMAHEINNPLAAISQNMQLIWHRLLIDSPKNKSFAKECGLSLEKMQSYLAKRDLHKMFEAVLEANIRASKIVKDMLNFAGRNNQHLYMPQDLAMLLDTTVTLASKDYELKNIHKFGKIEISRSYEVLPEVPCEAWKIQQVFLNILRNSAQWMKPDTVENHVPRIHLRITQQEDWAQVEIEDNGVGMSDRIVNRVFEPYFTTNIAGAGSGLGLSVAYYIVTDTHQGSMSITSVPEVGTTVTVRLPLEPIGG